VLCDCGANLGADTLVVLSGNAEERGDVCSRDKRGELGAFVSFPIHVLFFG
jgi:hypothetical protein